ncbi:major coat protein [Escherichia phage Lilleput]|nr:major coat protein [Escherichia phage Lilleput]
MSNVQTSASRDAIDLSHLVFNTGAIGRLKVASWTPVIAGDSFQLDAVGALRLSPLRRGLAIDSTVDYFTFYIPHRHIYGDAWIQFMKTGVAATSLNPVTTGEYVDSASYLGVIPSADGKVPKFLHQGYLNIYNNYFKAPWMADRTEANPSNLNDDDRRHGFRCCHLKNIWSAPLPPQTEITRAMTTGATSIDIMGLQAAYAQLHTDQERDYFMQRYRDVISSFGGKTHYDADNRPLLLMRSNFWASGYDIDGTDQTSLGQFSGRVQQTFRHSVPRFFVPEHGVIMTLQLVRFPPTCTEETHYLVGKGALNYTDLAGDPTLYANLPPREIEMKTLFRGAAGSSEKIKIAEGQWYRYHPSYVDGQYHNLQGFPFIPNGPTGNMENRVLIDHKKYDECFQSLQLTHWNAQAKYNVTVYRHIPTTRDSIMTS